LAPFTIALGGQIGQPAYSKSGDVAYRFLRRLAILYSLIQNKGHPASTFASDIQGLAKFAQIVKHSCQLVDH
jgi:hypothetical protein